MPKRNLSFEEWYESVHADSKSYAEAVQIMIENEVWLAIVDDAFAKSIVNNEKPWRYLARELSLKKKKAKKLYKKHNVFSRDKLKRFAQVLQLDVC